MLIPTRNWLEWIGKFFVSPNNLYVLEAISMINQLIITEATDITLENPNSWVIDKIINLTKGVFRFTLTVKSTSARYIIDHNRKKFYDSTILLSSKDVSILNDLIDRGYFQWTYEYEQDSILRNYFEVIIFNPITSKMDLKYQKVLLDSNIPWSFIRRELLHKLELAEVNILEELYLSYFTALLILMKVLGLRRYFRGISLVLDMYEHQKIQLTSRPPDNLFKLADEILQKYSGM